MTSMGCDIHEYVEYLVSDQDGNTRWKGEEGPSMSRNYLLFGALTNGAVRGPALPGNVAPDLQGTPHRMSSAVFYQDYAPVMAEISPQQAEEFELRDEERWSVANEGKLIANSPVSLAQANSWRGGTDWVRINPLGEVEASDKADWPGPGWCVAHPDWHSRSHLSLEQLQIVVEAYDAIVVAGGQVTVPRVWLGQLGEQTPGLDATLVETAWTRFSWRAVEKSSQTIDAKSAYQMINQRLSWPELLGYHWHSLAHWSKTQLDDHPDVPIEMVDIEILDQPIEPSKDLHALLELMKRRQARPEVQEVRFTFWFDN